MMCLTRVLFYVLYFVLGGTCVYLDLFALCKGWGYPLRMWPYMTWSWYIHVRHLNGYHRWLVNKNTFMCHSQNLDTCDYELHLKLHAKLGFIDIVVSTSAFRFAKHNDYFLSDDCVQFQRFNRTAEMLFWRATSRSHQSISSCRKRSQGLAWMTPIAKI